MHLTARRITRDYINGNIPYLSPARRDEMVDYVVEKSLEAVMRFRPDHETLSYGSKGGKHFDSWICDQMWNRCIDWLRSKQEGNGDKRYGNDNRIVLTDMEDEPADLHFEKQTSESRVQRWQRNADARGWPSLADMVCYVMDQACDQLEGVAA